MAEVLGTVSAVVNIVQFAGQILVSGYGFIHKVRGAPIELSRLLSEVAILHSLLDRLRTEVAGDDDGAGMQTALQSLEKEGIFESCQKLFHDVDNAIRACQQSSEHSIKNIGRRLKWPFKEKETKRMMQELAKVRETVSLALDIDMRSTVKRIEKTALKIDASTSAMGEHMIKNNEQNKRQEVLDWLFPTAIDFESNHKNALSLRAAGTGHWLLKSPEFHDWIAGSNGFMWLHGIPGSGKTVLSATIIEYIRSNSSRGSTGLGFFYCDQRDREKQDIGNLLSSLLIQLIEQDQLTLDYVQELYDSKISSRSSTGDTVAPSSEERINLLKRISLRWKRVLIIIDALDESSNPNEFIQKLHELRIPTAAASRIQVLVTSREDMSLERGIRPLCTSELSLMENMRTDISTYITSEVRSRISKGVLKLRNLSLADHIISKLEEQATGMILLAKLQLDYICGLRCDRDIRTALTKLPVGLTGVYARILDQISTKEHENLEDIKNIFCWLTGSIVPLSLGQIAEAISIRPGDRFLDKDGIATDHSDLAALCGSLVSIQRQGDSKGNSNDSHRVLSFAHFSIQEYLQSPLILESASRKFYQHHKTAHHTLARTCIKYLSLLDFSQPLNSDNKILTHKEGHALYRKFSCNYAMLDYASSFWPLHLRESNISRAVFDSEVRGSLEWFLDPKRHYGTYTLWQQAYRRNATTYSKSRPPLYYAIEFQVNHLVDVLLPLEPEEIDRLHDDGLSALHMASIHGVLSTVLRLLHAGATVDLKPGMEFNGRTALHFAAEKGDTAVVRALLEVGKASVHATSSSGATAFYRAVRAGSLGCLGLLYAAGSDINVLTWDKWTPLHEAVECWHDEMVEKLLELGADASVKTLDGATPLDMARDMGNERIVELLSAVDDEDRMSE